MSTPRTARLARAGAAVAVGAAVAFPLYNPDLYWHLSAGLRMAQLRAIPAADWLSSTRAGAPWRDFEWLSELLFYAAYRAGGAAGLLALKGALTALLAVLCARSPRLRAAPAGVPAAALCVLGAALVPFADLRPDLFSAAAFSALLNLLDARRLRPAGAFALFALWANLHAGYPYGLALLGVFLLFAAPGERRPLAGALCAAAAGCCFQPGGPRAFEILARHWRDMAGLSSYVLEWRAPAPSNSWHWPFLACACGAAAAAALAWRSRRRLDAAGACSAALFGALAARHVRLALFFCVLAVPLGAAWLLEAARAGKRARAAALAVGGALAVCGPLYAAALAARAGAFRRLVRPVMPPQAAAFLAREKPALGGRAVYAHAWGWLGYLGWRLYPDYRVFADGRYLFHDLLVESRQASRDPKSWQAFLDRYGLDLVLLERQGPSLPTTRLYPDGATRQIARPYYAVFMPKERWALVEWDEAALLFARRTSLAPGWTAEREYLLARPDDEAALRDALARGEADPAGLARELARHDGDDAALRSTPPLP